MECSDRPLFDALCFISCRCPCHSIYLPFHALSLFLRSSRLRPGFSYTLYDYIPPGAFLERLSTVYCLSLFSFCYVRQYSEQRCDQVYLELNGLHILFLVELSVCCVWLQLVVVHSHVVKGPCSSIFIIVAAREK